MGKKNRFLSEGIDEDGYLTITSELSASRHAFSVKIDSSTPMEWSEALLALAHWLSEEAKKMHPQLHDDSDTGDGSIDE